MNSKPHTEPCPIGTIKVIGQVDHIKVQVEIAVKISPYRKGVTTEIYTDWETGGGKYFYVENLFNTINEAQAECDKRNKKLRDAEALIAAEKERQNET